MITEFRNRHLKSTGLILEGGRVRVLDQRHLPDSEVWIQVENTEHMASLIQALSVRGAPLIGVAAALTLAQEACANPGTQRLQKAAALLREARPTAVNLMCAIDRIMREAPDFEPDQIAETAIEIFLEDVRMCEGMAEAGAALIGRLENILTICNTGGLATVGLGTAFASIHRAHQQGKNIHVFVTETRPLLQGGRLTTWELKKSGIPHTLITDSMAATVMRSGKIHRVLTGADRISRRGDYANKIGTYSLAVNASFHKIPFYPVAPWSTVDLNCESAKEIPIEERKADEVLGAQGSFGQVRWAPEDTEVYNPSFDVTPAELVTGVVLDRGYYEIKSFQQLCEKNHLLKAEKD